MAVQENKSADGVPDVWFEMDFGDGKGYRRISIETVEKLQPVFIEELAKLMEGAASRLEYAIRIAYDSQMNSANDRVSGKSLKERILSAIYFQINQRSDGIELGVFDLGKVIAETSQPEDTVVGGRSVFEMVEDGYEPSKAFGFIPHEYAIELAKSAALEHSWSQERTFAFVARVDQSFRGKEGEGIMVNCLEPLFHEFPSNDTNDKEKYFGTPFDFGILPHSGWEGYHVLRDMGGMLATEDKDGGGRHWLEALMDRAVRNTAIRLEAMA